VNLLEITARPDPLLMDMRILVIDDEPAALKIIQDMLFGLGVTQVLATTSAFKGRDAVMSGPEGVINLVMCDLRMPGLSGLEFLREVRAARPELPFLMITGAADPQSVIAAKDSGVTAYLRKPFSTSELMKKLTTIARIQAHRQAQATRPAA
jgi:CheY-like chemotaxis protein